MNFVFLHGGPGLNSIREEQSLKESISNLGHIGYFWNEPAPFRSEGQLQSPQSLEEWISSAKTAFLEQSQFGPVTLVAHCFAVIPAMLISQEYPEKCVELILISPGFDLHEVQKNILRLARADFKERGITTPVEQLSDLLRQTKSTFDHAIEEGFKIALTNENLLSYYFNNKEVMQDYFKVLSSEEGQMSISSCFDVLRDFGKNENTLPLQKNRSIETTVIFGQHDPILSIRHEIDLAKEYFSNPKIFVFEKSSHYPALEQKEKFLSIIAEKEKPNELSSTL